MCEIQDLGNSLARGHQHGQDGAGLLSWEADRFVASTTNHCWKAWWVHHDGRGALQLLLNGELGEITELHRKGLQELLRTLARRIMRWCEIDRREPSDSEEALLVLMVKLRAELRAARITTAAIAASAVQAPHRGTALQTR